MKRWEWQRDYLLVEVGIDNRFVGKQVAEIATIENEKWQIMAVSQPVLQDCFIDFQRISTTSREVLDRIFLLLTDCSDP